MFLRPIIGQVSCEQEAERRIASTAGTASATRKAKTEANGLVGEAAGAARETVQGSD